VPQLLALGVCYCQSRPIDYLSGARWQPRTRTRPHSSPLR
jgi:hypothetical protein